MFGISILNSVSFPFFEIFPNIFFSWTESCTRKCYLALMAITPRSYWHRMVIILNHHVCVCDSMPLKVYAYVWYWIQKSEWIFATLFAKQFIRFSCVLWSDESGTWYHKNICYELCVIWQKKKNRLSYQLESFLIENWRFLSRQSYQFCEEKK